MRRPAHHDADPAGGEGVPDRPTHVRVCGDVTQEQRAQGAHT